MSNSLEEYSSRYMNLYDMILRSNTMLCMINEIGEQSPTENFNALGYIDECLKYLLGLTVWQICYDENLDANTIPNLHKYIKGKAAKTPDIPLKKRLKAPLKNMRHKYLAHNDKNKSGIEEIAINDLAELLDELRKWLNTLCNPQLDSQVSELTDENLNQIKEYVHLGMIPLLNRTDDSRRTKDHA